MKIRFLLIGTSLSLIPQTINAQCVATQDCATLGYTETSCSGGNGVKCPFGNKWACFKSDSEYEQEFCTKYGFTLSCTGTNQIGASKACHGKYSECSCASGYEWKDGSCQEILNGAAGDVYKCNGKVVGVKASGMNFYVAIEDLGRNDWNYANSSCQRYSFCGNLKGTLPTKEQLLIIYNNKSTVNSQLSINGGTKMMEKQYWSSTYHSGSFGTTYYYIVNMSSGRTDGAHKDNYSNYIRPILTSW